VFVALATVIGTPCLYIHERLSILVDYGTEVGAVYPNIAPKVAKSMVDECQGPPLDLRA
jgi:hypothetical protein